MSQGSLPSQIASRFGRGDVVAAATLATTDMDVEVDDEGLMDHDGGSGQIMDSDFFNGARTASRTHRLASC
jgi:hypothetical protein